MYILPLLLKINQDLNCLVRVVGSQIRFLMEIHHETPIPTPSHNALLARGRQGSSLSSGRLEQAGFSQDLGRFGPTRTSKGAAACLEGDLVFSTRFSTLPEVNPPCL